MPAQGGMKQGDPGAVGMGVKHRYYTFTGSKPLAAFRIPEKCCTVGIVKISTATKVQMAAYQAALTTPPAMVDASAATVAADGSMVSRPVKPGEIFVFEHDDGTTNIGTVTFVLEGDELPATLAALGIVEPA